MAKISVSKAYAKWMDEDAARLNAMAELARKVAVTLPSKEEAEKRAFCPTGSGGGIDNSCSSVSASDPSLKERVPFKPIGDGKNSDFIRVPSVDELTEALTGSNSSKGTKIGSAKDLPAGTPVALRIDIPAFNYSTKNMGKAIYAVTIHENKGGKSFGSPLAYEPMARLTGPVTFAAKEKEATKVATGEANKFPLATVKGKFDPSRVMPPDIDSWTPVGYDPKKASYFYDKKTGREVMGGTDALSVGNSVFVRVPKYGYRNAKETYRDAGFWGIECRAADCGRDADGRFGSGNKCAGEEGDGETSTSTTPPRPSTKMPTAKVGDPANGTAWLSPSGVFHPVPRATPPQFRPQAPRGFMTHDQWASLHGHEGGEDSLIKAGWTRVAQSGRTLYVQTGGKPLTHSQLKSLKDQAMTAGNDEVEHDLGGDKRRTIWSKNDRSFYDDAEARAFCATGEGNGVDNSCSSSDGGSSDTKSSSTATASPSPQEPASNLFSNNENTQWSPASGREPFPGASRYSDISVSGGKAVASSLDSMGIKPEDAVSLLGAPERSSVFMRPAPEFGQKFYAFSGTNTPPVFMGFEADVAGIRRGLEGTYVLGSRKNNETGKQDLVLYGNVMDVLPAVTATPERRHAAAREFYKTMTRGIENARKAGVSTVMFSAAGNSTDSDRAGSFRGYTIWPRMGFDGPLPQHIRSKLPEDLSHARTLMDLHATREGTKWWAKNGEDIDVELNLADRNSPQNKVFDRFVKHFSRDRREMPLGEGDGWLSPEDLARLDEMWAEIWDEEDILDDYDGGEQKFLMESRAFCATGVGGGIDNSCGSGEPGRILMAPDTGGGSGGGVGRWGGKTERWGRSSQTEIWTPDKPLFPGAERFASIKIHRPNDVKGQIEDGLKMTVADAILAAGPISQSVVDRTRITVPRLEVISSGSGIEMHWTTMGATTGEGYAEDEIQFREPRGTAVKAVEAGRDLWVTQSGPVLRMGGLFIHPDFRGKGIGLESVLHSTSSPVVRLEMEAERYDSPNPRSRMTGYKVWPKYGYDAPISVVRQHIQSGGLPQFLSKCKTISDVYATPGGPEWWAENGGPIPLVFDRSPRSRSWQTLLKYSDRTRSKRSMTNPEKIGCDSDTDESVDSFWSRVQSGEEKLSGKAVTQEEWDRWKEETKEFAKDGRPPEVRPH